MLLLPYKFHRVAVVIAATLFYWFLKIISNMKLIWGVSIYNTCKDKIPIFQTLDAIHKF